MWFTSVLIQWFGTGFGLAATVCFLKCYEKKEVYSKKRRIQIMKAVSIETGYQNSSLAVAMITLSFPLDTPEEVATMWNVQVIPLLYLVFLVISSVVIVSAYRFGWKAKEE